MILDCNQVIIKLRKIIYSGLPQSIIPIQSSWRTLRTIAHSLMVHVRVLEYYIHFVLIYTVDHIFLVLPIIYLISKDGKPTTPHKLVTGTKPSILHLRVFFVCCMKSYCICWDKGVKHAPPGAKWFLWYLYCNSTASKRMSCLCTTQTEDHIFMRCCFWWEFF